MGNVGDITSPHILTCVCQAYNCPRRDSLFLKYLKRRYIKNGKTHYQTYSNMFSKKTDSIHACGSQISLRKLNKLNWCLVCIKQNIYWCFSTAKNLRIFNMACIYMHLNVSNSKKFPQMRNNTMQIQASWHICCPKGLE